MSSTFNILLVTSDRGLLREIESALAQMAGVRPVLQTADDLRQGAEAARSRSPEMALVEMTGDLAGLQTFAREVAAASPDTTVAAVFRPDVFGEEVSESEVLITAIRAGVKDFLRRPVSSAELEELLARTVAPAARRAGRPGAIVSFISNKGGVGKSTLAVNSACGLARSHPGRVLLVDASLQMGVCASMLDLQPAATIADAVRERDRLDETLLRQLATPHHSGLHLLAAPVDAVEAADVDDDGISRILTLARRSYDFVIVDTFPVFDRVVLAILDLSERAYIVSENVVPTLLGTVKLVQLLESLGYPEDRQRLVLNRYTTAGGNLKRRDVSHRLGRTVDHMFPADRRLMVAANTGVPAVTSAAGWFGFGRRIRRLLSELEELRSAADVSANGHLTLSNGNATAVEKPPAAEN